MGCVLSFIRLFATPWTVACQAPLSMGIFQARILEWIAMSSSRGSSQPRDRTQISCITCGFFTIWATRKTSILDWLAYPFFKGSSWPRDQTGVSCTAGGFLTHWATREAPVSVSWFSKCFLYNGAQPIFQRYSFWPELAERMLLLVTGDLRAIPK